MGNETSGRNSIVSKDESGSNNMHIDNNQDKKHVSQQTKQSEKLTGNVGQQQIELDNEDEITLPGDNKKQWNLNDAVYIYSSVMNEYMPGIIVEIDNETKEFTIRYWDIQSLEIKHKKRKLLDCNEVKTREYNTAYDPWNMPFSVDKLNTDTIKAVKQQLLKYEDIIQEKEYVDIDEWFIQFKIFLKDKQTLRITNPFIRLISCYLSENIQSWIGIFVKYIYVMILFQQQSKDKQHFNAKLEVLFNILNVGSEHIDNEALKIVCVMYAKSMITEFNDESDVIEQDRKKKIGEFAHKLVQKITEQDEEIDIDEFKLLVEDSKEMNSIISQSVNNFILEERSTIIAT